MFGPNSFMVLRCMLRKPAPFGSSQWELIFFRFFCDFVMTQVYLANDLVFSSIHIDFSIISSNSDLEISKTKLHAYLIFVIFFTRAKFLENKIYTEKRQFFTLNL